jgi:hypothetical protein
VARIILIGDQLGKEIVLVEEGLLFAAGLGIVFGIWLLVGIGAFRHDASPVAGEAGKERTSATSKAAKPR